MSGTAYMGLDPGQSGGIAVIYGDGKVSAYPMPETERDLIDLIRAEQKLCEWGLKAAIEQVSARPGQGVSSMFKFGMGYGGLRMAVVASGIPMRSVTPQAWQKALQCLTGGDKMVAVRRAQELFPNFDWPSTKCGKLAIADALLLAEWLRREEIGHGH